MPNRALFAAGMQIKRVQLQKSAAVDRMLAPVGLSLSLWAVLTRIHEIPDQSSHSLAEATFMTDQSFGELAAKLERRGLLVRENSAGRVIRHRLTAAGSKLLAKAEPLVAKAFERQFAALTSAELEQLVSLLERVAQK